MDSEKRQNNSLYEFLGWLEANKKRVTIGTAVTLAVIGLIATVIWYKNQQEFAASEALSALRLPLHPSDPVPPDTADKLQKLAAEYAGTAAAVRAELIRAGLLYTDGKYPEAQTAFENFVRDHADSQWVPQATFSAAVCLDAQNKVNDAIAKYEDFARRYPTDPNVDQARLDMAGLYEASGKPAQALEQYDKISKSMSFGPAFSEAQERQRLLFLKFPQLAATNTFNAAMNPASPVPTGAVTAVKTNLAAPAATNRPPKIPPAPLTPAPAKP